MTDSRTELTIAADHRLKSATCHYYNGLERIPLCPEHYNMWGQDMPDHFDPSLEKWETYEP